MNGPVFERNLERLLTRAYARALPRASFRDGLRRDFLARSARFGAADEHETPVRRAWPLRRVATLAAAAAVLALVFGLWWAGASRPTSLETFLARGEVATRLAPDGSWSAAEGVVEHDGGFLELVTPAEARATIASAAAAFEAEPGTRVVLRGAGAALRVELPAGGLSVDRGPEDAALVVSTSEGELAVRRGEVRVAYEPPPDPRADWGAWVRILVRSGEASVHAADGEHTLGAGSEAFLRGGELLGAAQPGPEPAIVSARTRVAPPQDPGTGGETAVAKDPPQVFGTVLAGAPPVPVTRFQVIVLAEVSLPQVADPEAYAFEAEDGRFELRGLSPRRYAVFVRAEGYALWRGELIEVQESGAGLPNEIHPVLETGARVRGLVVDAGTGLPIADALVVSESDAPVQALSIGLDDVPHDLLTLARTGAGGGFELDGLTPGQQVLRAWAPGYGPAWSEPFHLPAERPLERDLELELERGAVLQGVAMDGNGQPVENGFVVCSLTDFSAAHPVMSYGGSFTDVEGRYEIRDLPQGHWPLLFFRSVVDDTAPGPQLNFVQTFAGATVRHDFLGPADGLQLAGRIFEADGSPSVGRPLWLIPADAMGPEAMISTHTGADGSYLFSGLERENYLVFVSGLTPADMVVLGRADLRAGADLMEHDLRLSGGSITGRVVDGVTGEPLAFAGVVLLRMNDPIDRNGFRGMMMSGEDGRFTFEGVSAGSYQLLAFASGSTYGHEVVRDLRLDEGAELASGDVYLYPGGALDLRVLGPDGEPLAGAVVTTDFEDGLTYCLNEFQVTQADGHFRMKGISAGIWTLRIEAEGMRSAVREVVIPVSTVPTRVEVRLERE